MVKIIKQNFLFIISLLSILIIQIPLIFPFFHSGFFPSHDDFQVVRVFEISQAIKYGDFPPRWAAGLLYGHGYPIFNFYAPFSYLIGASFVNLGFNYLVATKMVFILYFLISACGIFLLLNNLTGLLPAIVGTIVFSFVPYRALDVYVRGTLGEFAAYSIFPLILWANIQLVNFPASIIRSAVFGLLIAILIISHSISSFIYLTFLAAFNLFGLMMVEKKYRARLLLNLIHSAVLGLAISCFYWLPIIYEYNLIKLSEISFPYDQYFLTFSQIWQSSWGFEGFIEKNPMSLQLGKVLIVTSISAFILNIFIKTKLRKLFIFFSVIFLLSILLETRISQIFWGNLTFLHMLQFPWRYHILITILGAILTSSFIYLLKTKLHSGFLGKISSSLLIVMVIFLTIHESYSFFRPKLYSNTPAVSETTTWNDEYLPKWVKIKPKEYAAEKVKFIKGEGEIDNIEWGYLQKSFSVNTNTNSVIQIAHIYYPGWKASVNGKKVGVFYDNLHGLMSINISSGLSFVEFKFTRTSWRLTAEIISILGCIYTAYYFLKGFSFYRPKSKKH